MTKKVPAKKQPIPAQQIPIKSFTLAAPGRLRQLVTPVGIIQAFDPTKTKEHPSYKKYTGVWDTGASATAISEKVVQECDLKPIDMINTHTAAGEHRSNVYLVNVMLPNNVGFFNLRVTEGNLTGPFDVLIGMDIIGSGDFAITNHRGKTLFSFRAPSIGRIDFVKPDNTFISPDERTEKIKEAPKSIKVGRNAPCPCGSKKKYKKCCGK